MNSSGVEPASYRDPSGVVFYSNGEVFRTVNAVYRSHYERLFESGLYRELTEAGRLIPHDEVDAPDGTPGTPWKVLKPQQLSFISYPYEWCFSQLKDAALATLEIQLAALGHEMTLKDANAFNVQFEAGRPLLIDTLSFEDYREGEPWVAYRQFCEQFLAPLALMSKVDVRLSQLLRPNLDGVPLDLASQLLPRRTYASFSLLSHIHLHARAQSRYADAGAEGSSSEASKGKKPRTSKLALTALIENLRSCVKGLKWRAGDTEWGDYYGATNYSERGMEHKKRVVADFLDRVEPRVVCDMGSNTGVFTRIAAERAERVLAFDLDPATIESAYLKCRSDQTKNILPLCLDLMNPSPGLGWRAQERSGFLSRLPGDTSLALALIHHLAVGRNVPIASIAEFFAASCRQLIIEFVPKSDSQVKRLLATRTDVFDDYLQDVFENEFRKHFDVREAVALEETERTLYLMSRKAESGS
ncbi:MAG: SAM-dependent methyltransferase [Planctomycetota bacterium]